MFQTVFQSLDEGTKLGPQLALLIFMAVFLAQLVRILRAPRRKMQAQAELPLAEELPPRREQEARQ